LRSLWIKAKGGEVSTARQSSSSSGELILSIELICN
jgi:hypothetical protein